MSDYWECDCGWSYGDDGLYYIEDGEVQDCTGYNKETRRLESTAPEGKEVYPKIGPANYNRWAAYEFGGFPTDWEETHRCPHCDKEFAFENSSY